jgi:signal transduction histidine kinase
VVERVRSMAKRSPSVPALLTLADVVDDVVALAAAESARRRVAIRSEVAADLPSVAGDRVQLQQVLLNLVVNAMDAMASVPESERLLEIRARRDLRDGRPAVTVSVRDHGVGLEDTELDRLFDAFYSTKPHGMGMGLAISHSIIEAHRGSLWAEANQGPGATFHSAFPPPRSDPGPDPGRHDSYLGVELKPGLLRVRAGPPPE